MTLFAPSAVRPPVGIYPLDRAVGNAARDLRLAAWGAIGESNSITSTRSYTEQIRALSSALCEAAEDGGGSIDSTAAYAALFSALCEATEDGDGSIDHAAATYALRFLFLLPIELPQPEIAVDADGDIALEWDYGPRRITSVRVAGDGTIHFASLLGHSTLHGSEVDYEGIPSGLLAAIERVIEPNHH